MIVIALFFPPTSLNVFGRHFLGGNEAFVEVPGVDQLGNNLPVDLCPLRLAVGGSRAAHFHSFIPFQS